MRREHVPCYGADKAKFFALACALEGRSRNTQCSPKGGSGFALCLPPVSEVAGGGPLLLFPSLFSPSQTDECRRIMLPGLSALIFLPLEPGTGARGLRVRQEDAGACVLKPRLVSPRTQAVEVCLFVRVVVAFACIRGEEPELLCALPLQASLEWADSSLDCLGGDSL